MIILLLKTVKPFGEVLILLAAPMVVGQNDGSAKERLLNGIFSEGQGLAEKTCRSAELLGLGLAEVVIQKP